MSLRVSLALVCVALAGCSDTESASSPAASTPGPGVSTQVAAAEWKAVIDDWYVDGTIDEPHRCLAIREAIERLPSRDHSEAYADLLRLASCPSGTTCCSRSQTGRGRSQRPAGRR